MQLIYFLYLPVLYISIFYLLTFFENKKVKRKKSRIRKWPSVSILIPAFNEEQTIERAIKSCHQLDYPSKIEVIVIDDGSEDGTNQIAQKYAEKGKIKLLSQPNRGKGAALNSGLEIAEGKFIACLDADSFPSEGALKKLISKFEPGVGAVAPAMKVHNPSSLLAKIQHVEYLVGIFLRKIASWIDSVYVAPGPFSLYRKEAIKKLGGFDNSSLVEDMEMAYRLQNNQWKIKSSSSAEVFTQVPKSIRAFWKQRNRWYKGSLECVLQYKKMLFNRKYGDFGFFQLPVNIIQGPLAIIVSGWIVFTISLSLWNSIKRAMLIGLWSLIPSFNLFLSSKLASIGTDFMGLLLLGSVVALSTILLWLSYKKTRERYKKSETLGLIAYMFIFFIFIGAVWLLIVVEFLLGKKRSW